MPSLIPLAMAGVGAAASWYGGRKAKQAGRRAEQGYNRMAQDAQGRERQQQGQTDASRNMYMQAAQGVQNFDPSSYMNTQAGAMFNNLSGQYDAQNRGRQVGLSRRGLFASDLGGGQAQRDFNGQLGNAMAGLSMQGAQMRQGALGQAAGMYGNMYGQDVNQGNMFYNAGMGLQGSAIGQRATGDGAAAAGWGQLGGSLIGGAIGMWPGEWGGQGKMPGGPTPNTTMGNYPPPAIPSRRFY